MGDLLDWIGAACMFASAALIAIWVAGAMYYDLADEARWGAWLGLVWIVGVVVLFAVWEPLWQSWLVLLGVAALFLVWWFAQKPSHDREWDVTVAVLPR